MFHHKLLWRHLTLVFLGIPWLFCNQCWADHILATFNGGSPYSYYSDVANWTPNVVPVNGGGNTFDVELLDHWVNFDIDATVNNISSQSGYLFVDGHNFTATQSSNLSTVYINTQVADAAVDLGTFAKYSPGTHSFVGDTISVKALPSRIATLQFNGADIVNNAGYIS